MQDCIRKFDETHIGEDCSRLSGEHENELFFECIFNTLNGLTLKNCALTRSKFVTQHVKDALGFTLTLDCHSFKNVEFSPLLFDLFLVLAASSKGNDEKRKKLLEVVGVDRAKAIERLLGEME